MTSDVKAEVKEKKVERKTTGDTDDAVFSKKGGVTRSVIGASSGYKFISRGFRKILNSTECRGFRPEELIKYKRVLAQEEENRKSNDTAYAKRPVEEVLT